MILIARDSFVIKTVYMVGVQKRNVGGVNIFMNGKKMDDTISRQMAIDALDCINETEEVLRSLPSAQPERKTGQWIFEVRKRLVDETDDGSVYRTEKWWSCSECGYAKGYQISKPSSNYCENCGAKMRKSGEE